MDFSFTRNACDPVYWIMHFQCLPVGQQINTIVLLVLTFSILLKLLEAGFNRCTCLLNGSFRPCEGLGLARSVVYCGWSDNVCQTIFCGVCSISATKKPAQPCNLVSGFQSWSASSFLKSISCPTLVVWHHQPFAKSKGLVKYRL